MPINTRTLATLLLVLGSLLGSSCDRPPGSPTSPTPSTSGDLPDLVFSLPGKGEMHYQITSVSPPIGTPVKVGDVVRVSYSINGPSADIYLTARFVTNPAQPGNDQCGLGNGSGVSMVANKAITGSDSFTVPEGMTSVDIYRLSVWMSLQTPSACPDSSHIREVGLHNMVTNKS